MFVQSKIKRLLEKIHLLLIKDSFTSVFNVLTKQSENGNFRPVLLTSWHFFKISFSKMNHYSKAVNFSLDYLADFKLS